MLDISNKTKTLRIASAQAKVKLSSATIELIHQNKIPKGNPLEVAQVAAIQAAKKTSDIIPYCHPLPIDYVGVKFDFDNELIIVNTTVKAIYKTGVEMEALTAASVAALTLYDMLKMLDDSMEIVSIKLLEKKGGKSDFKDVYDKPMKAAVLVMSDSIASGREVDLSGQIIRERLENEGFDVVDYKIIPDDIEQISKALIHYADEDKLDLVLTSGGTGFSPRDNTPETMTKIIERDVPGISEAIRQYGQERTPHSMLSRAKAGIRGKTLIVNLPGSKNGVMDSLNALFPGLHHSFKMIQGKGH